MQSDKIVAVVVTFNRLALLQECVDALRSQSRKLNAIVVVNNSSTDGTEAWLGEQTDIVTITQENKGGAFGFYTGIKAAFDKGLEWVWCMDDDGKPDTNALLELMKYDSEKPCVMNTLVVSKEDPEQIVFKTGKYTAVKEIDVDIIEGAANFFNGTLFHYEAIRRVGLPMGQLSIWGDETEYYNRIKFKHHLKVFTVAKAIHFHPSQYSRFYVREWDFLSGWKTFFYIRNKRFVLASQYSSKLRSLFSYIYFLTAFAGTILFYQKKNRIKKLKLLFSAGKDGLSKNTSKGIKDVRSFITKL